MPDMVAIRPATAGDIKAMCTLIFAHGLNPWNFLPEQEVTEHLKAIATGETQAVVAADNKNIVGFVTYYTTVDFDHYQPKQRSGKKHGYICEAVVHRNYAGQGLGQRLLKQAIENLNQQGFSDVYIERHEENQASAGMMRKAGFVEIDIFDDPKRRTSGSRRTSVSRISSQNPTS